MSYNAKLLSMSSDTYCPICNLESVCINVFKSAINVVVVVIVVGVRCVCYRLLHFLYEPGFSTQFSHGDYEPIILFHLVHPFLLESQLLAFNLISKEEWIP